MYQPSDTIIFRTPRFPLNASIEANWEELKQAISESSDDFYTMSSEALKTGSVGGWEAQDINAE